MYMYMYLCKCQGEHGLHTGSAGLGQRAALTEQACPGEVPEPDVLHSAAHKLRVGVGTELGQEHATLVSTRLSHLAACHTFSVHVFMRDEKEERKKQARSNKQTRQRNTAHPRQSLFIEKMSCLGWDSNPRHSILQTCIYALVGTHRVRAVWVEIARLPRVGLKPTTLYTPDMYIRVSGYTQGACSVGERGCVQCG